MKDNVCDICGKVTNKEESICDDHIAIRESIILEDREHKIFTIVLNEKWHIEYEGDKYKIISEPKTVEGGYEYAIKEYKDGMDR